MTSFRTALAKCLLPLRASEDFAEAMAPVASLSFHKSVQ